MKTLAETPLGSHAVVADVIGSHPAALRLLEMGLTPGTQVRVVGAAPLGDPLELEVRGYRLSVRRSEAASIDVAMP